MIRNFLCQCSLRIQKKRRLLAVNVLPCAECGLEPFGSNVYSTKSDIYFSTQQRHKMIKNWRSNWSHAHAYAKYVWWYVESPFCCEQIHLFQLLKRDESCLVSRLGVYWIWTSDSLLSSWSRGSTSKEESNLIWCGCCSVCSALTSLDDSVEMKWNEIWRWYERDMVSLKDNVELVFLNLITKFISICSCMSTKRPIVDRLTFFAKSQRETHQHTKQSLTNLLCLD